MLRRRRARTGEHRLRRKRVGFMHIAVLTNEFEPAIIGGLGIVATNLAEALRARGHTLLVITTGSSPKISDQEHAGMRVIRFPHGSEYHSRMHQRLYAEPILHYLRYLSDWPDIIHVHSLQADRLAIAMRDKCSARIVYTCHSLVSNEGLHKSSFRHMEIRQRHFMEQADMIVAPSNWLAMVLMAHRPATRDKIHVIPNGVKPHSISVLDRPRRPAQLLFAGRLIRQKGVAETIAAVADLKNIDRNVHLDIIGNGSMKYMRELKSQTNRLKVSGRVRFLGQCTHHTVLQHMRDAGVVIMPSRNESFGLVALEAMAVGTPLVSTQAGGLRDFVDSDTAVVIASPTRETISRAVAEVWANSGRTRKRQRSAFERALRYTWKVTASQYEAVMEGADPSTPTQ